ncbi:MAG TPA: quinone-dependent dihydroorotate dehydrogenase [Pyrinomonadaceae bacterium]|nr:quinone-dependent dihydroorotate dehydrogenase [Pyrinomonadaceae bacterium]
MLYRSILRPILFRLEPEAAHEMALRFCETTLRRNTLRNVLSRRFQTEPFGDLKRFDLTFRNPVGLAAGFDKNGVAAEGLAALGFGFIEAGTVTNLPQPGNPRPRLFRLAPDRALVNRMGFNNDGARKVAESLRLHRPACVLGVNIGKSRAVSVEEATADYLASFESIYEVADYVAVNVSSPNTPGLRALQHADALYALLHALQERNRELAGRVEGRKALPLLVKIAPDLQEHELEAIVDAVERAGVAGIIATNTTTERARLSSSPEVVKACGEGGLSGAPLRARSTEVVALLYSLTRGRIPIIGVGGIFSAEDAWEKICAGASLVQIYTGFIYEGPGIVRAINEGLHRKMVEHGFGSLDEAVGSRVATPAAA